MNAHWFPRFCLSAVLTTCAASATIISLDPAAADTAIDDGPQDGVFDGFVRPGGLIIDNNGYINMRPALEFDLSAIPTGALVSSATLTVRIDSVQGTRQVELHTYL